MTSVYLGAIGMGLLHGLEPGHGWLVAALLALRRPRPFHYGLLAAVMISFAHFVSSVVVVPVYFGLGWLVDFSLPIFRFLAAGILTYLAYRMYTEHPEPHRHGQPSQDYGIWGLAVYAFALGFAHEEEFALLAFLVAGVNPWWLVTAYALAVTASLIALTTIAIKAYDFSYERIHRYEPYLPKVSAAILLIFALLFVLGAY